VLKRILKELNVDEKKFPREVRWLIERRSGTASPSSSRAFRGVARRHQAGQVGKAYDDALAEAGAVDFTDLIRLP